MTEYERVREQLDTILATKLYGWGQERQLIKDGVIKEILSLKGIEIRADDQSYPEIPRKDIVHIIMGRDTALREAGFIKVIPKEEYGS